MVKNRIDIVTLGCSKNLVDSEKLMKMCEIKGFETCHNPEKLRGEYVVINTCGFIGDAKEESINMILEACQEKALRHVKKVFVMGCLSQRFPKELSEEIPEVDGWFGKFDWAHLLDYLSSIKSIDAMGPFDCGVERVITTPKHYAYVKISEGCSRKCAYCAIPLITGHHVSVPKEKILEEVKWLVSQGVKEIQLIAQELTFYGKDLYGKSCIAELVSDIADTPGVEWLRLHYAYPTDFPTDLLKVMREKPNVCKYLDIALQHISNPVLKRMHRHITSEETYQLIDTIRKEVPGIMLRTTLMVGFPGEMEEDFEQLKEFVQKVRFERLGAFAYSEEEGTCAAELYEDDVPEDIKQARLDEIMALQQEIASEKSASLVGHRLKVIIDRREGDFYVGRTEWDSPEVDPEVLIPVSGARLSEEDTIGHFFNVDITDSDEFDLYGRFVEDL
ncbi:MAG: 30S ribosomal protein S12 methylthiotransferase RimO [Bacteroidaceae bacterium]|nr:30S ribosomal protein S12 methylthiotransferase RimO [Bacteroidaceae bacterium]